MMEGGSSPRVRGPLRAGSGFQRRRRFIPARAGTTWLRCHGANQRCRFIPARAGTTAQGRRHLPACVGSSPRVRGPHHRPRACRIAANGSSPRVRGTRARTAEPGRSRRFIPARAGNTENRNIMRLKPRFIPARAGNTPLRAPRSRRLYGSSPRARGTLRPSATAALYRHGSSPRVRGTRHGRGQLRVWLMRFIPARAGNTLPTSAVLSQASRRFIPARAGNTYHLTARHISAVRFIPARAGNTQ